MDPSFCDLTYSVPFFNFGKGTDVDPIGLGDDEQSNF